MTCCMPTEVLGFNLETDWLKSMRQEHAVLAKQKYSDVPDKQLQHANPTLFLFTGRSKS